IKLTGIADAAGQAAAPLRPALAEIQQAADEALAKYNPLTPSTVTPIIARSLHQLRGLEARLAEMSMSEDERYQKRFLLNQKAADFSDALARSQGAVVDCLADDEVVTPGQAFAISIQAYTDAGVRLGRVTLNLPRGWTLQPQKESATTTDGRLAAQRDFKVTAAAA